MPFIARNRLAAFVLWCVLVLIAFSGMLLPLLQSALQQGYSSHIVLVPLIVGYLVWSNRKQVFSAPKYSFRSGGLLAAAGLALVIAEIIIRSRFSFEPASLLIVLSALTLILAGFWGFFGTHAVQNSVFSIFLLLFVLPVPMTFLDAILYFLQSKSADLTYWILTVLSVPVIRNGFVLTVPGVNVEVAKECSGINSSVALLILVTLFAHETLHTNWKRILLVLLVIPLSILKNGIRIAALTTLAIRVDPGFLTGTLHHQGGFVFFLITLALLYPIWKLLHASDEKKAKSVQATKVSAPTLQGLPD